MSAKRRDEIVIDKQQENQLKRCFQYKDDEDDRRIRSDLDLWHYHLQSAKTFEAPCCGAMLEGGHFYNSHENVCMVCDTMHYPMVFNPKCLHYVKAYAPNLYRRMQPYLGPDGLALPLSKRNAECQTDEPAPKRARIEDC